MLGRQGQEAHFSLVICGKADVAVAAGDHFCKHRYQPADSDHGGRRVVRTTAMEPELLQT